MTGDFFWLPVILCLIALGAFFAGAETGIYRISRFRLRVGLEQRRPFYKQLTRAVNDGQGLVLSLLCGNNIANYLATSLLTWRFLVHLGEDSHLAEAYATAVMVPVLFIFVDIIPKNIFFYRADELSGFFAPAIWFFYRLFTVSGTIGLLKKIFRLFSRIFGLSVDTAAVVDINQRAQVAQLIQETREVGLVSAVQKDIIQKLLNIPEVSIGTILIPLSRTAMIEANSGTEELIKLLRTSPYRRFPVYEKERTRILGYIDIYQALKDSGPLDLRKMAMPLEHIGVSSSVLDALTALRGKGDRMAMAVSDVPSGFGESRKVLGIITLTDAVEELIGEMSVRQSAV